VQHFGSDSNEPMFVQASTVDFHPAVTPISTEAPYTKHVVATPDQAKSTCSRLRSASKAAT